MPRKRSVALNETMKLRSMRFWSAFASTALGITFSNGWLAIEQQAGIAVYGQLMAPPSSGPVAAASPAPAKNSSTAQPANPLRDQALNWTAQAKLALGRGDVSQAKSFIEKANALRVPDSEFTTGQIRPWQVAMEVDRAERQRGSTTTHAPPTLAANNNFQPLPGPASRSPASTTPPGSMSTVPATGTVVTASATMPVQTNPPTGQSLVGPSVFLPKMDTTQVKPAAAMEQTIGTSTQSGNGEELYRSGVAALSAGDRDQAVKLFNEAWKYEREMDALTRAQLKDKLTLLQGNKSQSRPNAGEPITAMQQLNDEQNLARQKMWREVTTEIAEAEKMVDNDPHAALDRLQMLRQRVSQSSVDGAIRKSYLAMVDRVITNIQAYVEQNRPAIEQQETNRRIEDRMAMEAATRAKIDGEVQSMVDQYNELMEKGMYAEAEIVAKKVGQLDPNSEISAVLIGKATIAKDSRTKRNHRPQE